jgi:hypothetical protein
MRQRLCTAVGLAALLATTGTVGCSALGYRDRVLWRVPAPDGTLVAVCQEIPELDGPGYDVRLERQDGTLVRRLYTIGDGDPCSELAWSSDGRALAVLTGHVARLRFVDVDWALHNPAVTTAHWSWRQIDLSTERRRFEGSGLRFTGPRTVSLHLCDRRTPGSSPTCPDGSRTHSFDIPLPMVTGH